MKLICRQCGRINRYTNGEVIDSKGFSCEYCGFYMPKRVFAQRIVAAFAAVALILGYTYIQEYVLYEVSSEAVRIVSSIFVMLGIYLALMPLIALLMCFCTNCVTRKRLRKDQ